MADNKNSDFPKKEEKKELRRKAELSEEDIELKNNLTMLVDRVADSEVSISNTALTSLISSIRYSTSSSSVPKAVKFLRPYYSNLTTLYNNMNDIKNKQLLADILSILSISLSQGKRLCLYYRLLGTTNLLTEWGSEYVRSLTGELIEEYQHRQENNENTDDLLKLIKDIVPFNISNNAEAEGIDLLIEIDRIDLLPDLLISKNHDRSLLYLLASMPYSTDRDELTKIALAIIEISKNCADQRCRIHGLRAAMRVGDRELVKKIVESCSDPLIKQQMSYILFDCRISLPDILPSFSDISDFFKHLAIDLDVLPPKEPEDIYKTHLQGDIGSGSSMVDSTKQNLASAFVNAFINCAFGKDKLLLIEDSRYVFKVKDHAMISSTAALGLLLLWDIESGYSTIDKYALSTITHIKAGALLATGLISTNINSELDASIALLSEHVHDNDKPFNKLTSIIGLGFSYCNTNREEVLDLLLPLLDDNLQPMEILAFSALSLSLIFLGSANDAICGSIIQVLLDRPEEQLNDPTGRFLALSLGILFYGVGDASEAVLETLNVVTHPLGKLAALAVEFCANIGSGNVLLVQKFLALLSENLPEKSPGLDLQAVAVLGIAAVVFGEHIGSQMSFRLFEDLLQYCSQNIRKAVPLALAFVSVSDPQVQFVDTLSKLSHDADEEVSQNAIIGLGIIGAGTNHSRIASLLRQLASYYAKESNHLFLVKIAQGLIFLGKGLMTLNPLHSDRLLLSSPALSGLLIVMFSLLDSKNTILSYRHYLLYYISLAIRPRWLLTLDENLKPISIPVRVGQAVDTVTMAGTRKTITGFQTHSSPVLFSTGEKAELATDEYICISPVLEGIVIVKKNPNFSNGDEKESK